MQRKPYKRHENLDKMIKYLTENNKQNFKDYTFGYKKVKDILKETGLPRHTFYTAIKEIDPNIIEHRTSRKMTALNIIYQQIKRSIPFEYMEFDVEKLFGRNNHFDSYSLVKKRNAVMNKLKINGFDVSNISFMSAKRVKTWYKRYCVRNDLLLNQETGYRIAKKYKLATSIVFTIKREMHETKPLLKSIDLEQEKILIENIEIYDQFEQGKTVQELSETYNLNVWLVKVIIKYVKVMKSEVTQ